MTVLALDWSTCLMPFLYAEPSLRANVVRPTSLRLPLSSAPSLCHLRCAPLLHIAWRRVSAAFFDVHSLADQCDLQHHTTCPLAAGAFDTLPWPKGYTEAPCHGVPGPAALLCLCLRPALQCS